MQRTGEPRLPPDPKALLFKAANNLRLANNNAEKVANKKLTRENSTAKLKIAELEVPSDSEA